MKSTKRMEIVIIIKFSSSMNVLGVWTDQNIVQETIVAETTFSTTEIQSISVLRTSFQKNLEIIDVIVLLLVQKVNVQCHTEKMKYDSDSLQT